MDRAIDTAAAEQAAVGRIDDGIDRKLGDIAESHGEACCGRGNIGTNDLGRGHDDLLDRVLIAPNREGGHKVPRENR